MKDFQSKYLLSLFIFVCLLAPVFASALEISRPATTSRPSSSSATQPTVNRGQVQQAIPKTKMQSGYCYVNNTIEKSSEALCQRKRGQFFADKKDAQRVYDAASGYCCKDGTVSKKNRVTCVRGKGIFFLKQIDAKRTCDAVKGFCCDKGKVVAYSKGSCDRKKGVFFLKKADAEQFVAKQKGFCCLDGKVSPMIQKTCRQKKGQFFIQRSQATQTCKHERGFCCVDGKISNFSRSVCEKRQGAFSTNRSTLSKACVTKKTKQASTSVQTSRRTPVVVSASVATGKKGKQSVSQNAKKEFDDPVFKTGGKVQKSFDDPIFKPDSNKGFDDPVFKPDNSRDGFDDPIFKTDSSRKGVAQKATIATGFAGSNKQTKSSQNTLSMADVSLPASSLLFPGPKPIPVVYVKDRMVRIGSDIDRDGVRDDLTLLASDARFPCGPGGSLVEAEINVKKGNKYPNLAAQANDEGYVPFHSFTLQDRNSFIREFCTTGKKEIHPSVSFDIDMQKTCQLQDKTEREQITTVTLAMNIICDQHPEADPAAYSPNHPSYNVNVGNSLENARKKSDMDKTLGQTAPDSVPAISVSSAEHAGISTEAPSASLSLKHNSALIVDDMLILGSSSQSVYQANPSNTVTTNIDLELSCGTGVFSGATLNVKKNGIYSELYQLESDGHQILRDVSLMNSTEFMNEHCAAGTMYQDVGRTIEFLVKSNCKMLGESRQFEEKISVPIRIVSCDRRQPGKANGVGSDFSHQCPEGYHILGQSESTRKMTSKTEGFNKPMTCIENI